MRRRALVLIALAALLAVPTAAARTLRVNWLERKQIAADGAFVFRVTQITVSRRAWSAQVSIANRSSAGYERYPGCNGFAPQFASPGMALVYYGGGLGWSTGTWVRGATSTAPQVPSHFPAGTVWAGTMRGAGPVPRGRDLRLSFGFFAPAGEIVGACRSPLAERSASSGDQWYWVTDHTFRLD